MKTTVVLLLSMVLAFVVAHKLYLFEPQSRLNIGYTQEPPYSYISQTGEVSGIFPTTARHIAAELGYEEINWILLSFDNLIPSLLENRVDVVAAGMTISDKRLQEVCFSDPLLSSSSALLMQEDNKKYINTKAIIQQDMVFVTVKGSIESDYFNSLTLKRSHVEVEDTHIGLLMIQDEEADGLVLTLPTILELTKNYTVKYHILALADKVSHVQKSAFVFRQSDSELVSNWNVVQANYANAEEFGGMIDGLGFIPQFESDITTGPMSCKQT